MLPPEIASRSPVPMRADDGAELMAMSLREAREVFERQYLKAQLDPFRRQHLAHRELRRHGAIRAAPQAEVARRRRRAARDQPSHARLRIGHDHAGNCLRLRPGRLQHRALSGQRGERRHGDRHRPDRVKRVTDAIDVKGLVGFALAPAGSAAGRRRGCGHADRGDLCRRGQHGRLPGRPFPFNVPTKIARVRHQAYLDPAWRDMFSRDHLPIDVIISPEVEVARAIIRRLEVPGALDVIPMANDKVRAIAVRCLPDCPVVDTPLYQLTELFPDLHIFVVGIIRNDELIVPTPGDGDEGGRRGLFRRRHQPRPPRHGGVRPR